MCKTSSNAVYGLGFIGALIYNLTYASSFSQVLWGILKSMFWPAFLVHKLFAFFSL